jgi:hypothetical protein
MHDINTIHEKSITIRVEISKYIIFKSINVSYNWTELWEKLQLPNRGVNISHIPKPVVVRLSNPFAYSITTKQITSQHFLHVFPEGYSSPPHNKCCLSRPHTFHSCPYKLVFIFHFYVYEIRLNVKYGNCKLWNTPSHNAVYVQLQ